MAYKRYWDLFSSSSHEHVEWDEKEGRKRRANGQDNDIGWAISKTYIGFLNKIYEFHRSSWSITNKEKASYVSFDEEVIYMDNQGISSHLGYQGNNQSPREKNQGLRDHEGQWRDRDNQRRDKDNERMGDRYNHKISNPYVPAPRAKEPASQPSVSHPTNSIIKYMLAQVLKRVESMDNGVKELKSYVSNLT